MGPELGSIGWWQDGGDMAVHTTVLLCLSCLMSTEGICEHPRGEENCMGKTGELWELTPLWKADGLRGHLFGFRGNHGGLMCHWGVVLL